MARTDIPGLVVGLALLGAVASPAQAQEGTETRGRQDPAERERTRELNRWVEARNAQMARDDALARAEFEAAASEAAEAREAYDAAVAEYEALMAAYMAATAVGSIPDLHQRLDILNTSLTDVTCNVHRRGVATGTALFIRSGGAIRLDGPDEDNPGAIPITEVQLRCPLVSANRLHGNFRSAGRYVIQRSVGGGLVLVEVATTSADGR